MSRGFLIVAGTLNLVVGFLPPVDLLSVINFGMAAVCLSVAASK